MVVRGEAMESYGSSQVTSEGGENGSGGERSRGRVSRRELIARGGTAVVVIAAPGVLEACGGGSSKKTYGGLHPLESLSPHEAQTLEAALERLIPSDETGPGAREAKVWRYIDRSLARDYKPVAPLYTANLGALDKYSRQLHGKEFAQLGGTQQDSILADVESGKATGFTPGSAVFFATLWEHTLEGMFGDPYHGGNAGFVGWDLLNFPGIRLYVPPGDQMLDVNVRKAHASTTSFGIFQLNTEG
jgi:gluconate 2-dehydrogenase gamma chain